MSLSLFLCPTWLSLTQLEALVSAALDRAFDQILVWKFGRFVRSTMHLLSAPEEFDHLGIGFLSIRDQFDTSSPSKA